MVDLDRLSVFVLHAHDGRFHAESIHAMLSEPGVPADVWPVDGTGVAAWAHLVAFVMTPVAVVNGGLCHRQLERALALNRVVVAVRVGVDVARPAFLGDAPEVDLRGGRATVQGQLLDHVIHEASPRRVRKRLRQVLLAHRRRLIGLSPQARSAYERDICGPIEREIDVERRRIARARTSARRTSVVRPAAVASGEPVTRWEQPGRTGSSDSATVRMVNYPPGRATGFYDHDEEFVRFAEAVVASSVRLITLVGVRGTGKTALLARLWDSVGLRAHGPPDVMLYLSLPRLGSVSPAALVTALSAAIDGPSDEVREIVDDPGRAWWNRLDAVLTALGGARLVVAIDDADDLMTDDGTVRALYDGRVGPVVSYLLRHERPVLLILSLTSEAAGIGAEYGNRTRQVTLRSGLLETDAVRLLRANDPHGVYGIASTEDADLAYLSDRIAGNPHALETILAILRAGTATTIHDVLDVVRQEPDGADVHSLLIDWKLDDLSRTSQRVVEALAVFRGPVGPDAVDDLLTASLAAPDSAATLNLLVRQGLVRRDGDRFFLPRSDLARVVERIPPGRPDDWTVPRRLATRTGLVRLAARHHDRRRTERPASIQDLDPEFRRIALLIAAGELTVAATRMEFIDKEYLASWGQSYALVPWRHQLEGRLPSLAYELTNTSLLAEALRENGYPGRAYGTLLDLMHLHGGSLDIANQLRLELQVANALYDHGQTTLAAVRYQLVISEASAELALQRAKAHGGLLLCRTETGEFGSALEHYDRAAHIVGRLPFTAGPNTARQATRIGAELAMNVSIVHGWQGNVTAAVAALDDARCRAGEIGDEHLAGLSRCLHATLEIDGGNTGRARALATEAARLAGRAPSYTLSYEASVRLAVASLIDGDVPAALDAAGAAYRLARSDRQFLGAALYGLAQLRDGEVDRARDLLRQAGARTERLSKRENPSFEVLDWHGLLLCANAGQGTDYDLDANLDAYDQARLAAPERVAVERADRMLDVLARADPSAPVEAVRAAARGRGEQ